ncbi:MAG: DNA repair protein RecN [Gemmatimonadales bacterium]
MIVELRVRDLATIADVTLPMGPGLNVLSGETGAGKSMLVDALDLLLGGRADSAVVRPGRSRAVVEGVFEQASRTLRARIEILGLDLEDDRVVIRREVAAGGRSRAWVNGSPTTAGALAELAELLVDLHGQHEARSLVRPEVQRDLLDAYAKAGAERRALAETVAELERVTEEERVLAERRDEVRRRADYLRHVVAEIESARVRPGEDEELEAQARRLGQVEQLTDSASRLAAALDGDEGGALQALAAAARALGQLERADPSIGSWRELLETAEANAGELARLAREYAGGLEDDPALLARVEGRRDLLFRLRQKYGDTLAAVLDAGREAARELDLLDTADTDLRVLGGRRKALEQAAVTAGGALSARRREGAERLARAVNRYLPRLGLAGGRLRVALEPLPRPASTGAESVELLVRLNEGMEERALARTASGGELSRLMLALEVVLALEDAVPTLVFDEVDQGIGGEVGARVGEALATLAARRQVLVITHLPQIAARADHHLAVAKTSRGGLATSDVQVLHGEDRVAELARMLGDADADTARRHALALLSAR